VFHTAGNPPNSGSTIFANIGWIQNSSPAPTNMVAMNSASTDRSPVAVD
jgi:hypothetical protein